MSEVKGTLLTCDRCGATCFLKYTNEGVLKGWQYYYRTIVGHLCPNCNAEFEKIIKEFMENKRIESIRFEDTL